MPWSDSYASHLDLLQARLEARESAETVDWYRHRSRELQDIMERRQIGDLVLEVGERSIDEVATEITNRLGYGPSPG